MDTVKTQISAMRLPNTTTLIIKQRGEKKLFVSSNNSLVIDIVDLSSLLKFLLVSRLMSRKVLEGILSEITE